MSIWTKSTGIPIAIPCITSSNAALAWCNNPMCRALVTMTVF